MVVACVTLASSAASVTGYFLHHQWMRTSHVWRDSLDFSKKLDIPTRRLRVFLHVGSGHLHLCLSVRSFNTCTVIMVIIYSLSSLVLYVSSHLNYHILTELFDCDDNRCLFWNLAIWVSTSANITGPISSSCYCYYSIYLAQFPRACDKLIAFVPLAKPEYNNDRASPSLSVTAESLRRGKRAWSWPAGDETHRRGHTISHVKCVVYSRVLSQLRVWSVYYSWSENATYKSVSILQHCFITQLSCSTMGVSSLAQ